MHHFENHSCKIMKKSSTSDIYSKINTW